MSYWSTTYCILMRSNERSKLNQCKLSELATTTKWSIIFSFLPLLPIWILYKNLEQSGPSVTRLPIHIISSQVQSAYRIAIQITLRFELTNMCCIEKWSLETLHQFNTTSSIRYCERVTSIQKHSHSLGNHRLLQYVTFFTISILTWCINRLSSARQELAYEFMNVTVLQNQRFLLSTRVQNQYSSAAVLSKSLAVGLKRTLQFIRSGQNVWGVRLSLMM